MAHTDKRSVTHIRCLLVLKKLGGAGAGVRSVELAAELDVSKPSVYAMLRTLGEMGLVRKQPHSLAWLTPDGIRLAGQYAQYYDAVFAALRQAAGNQSGGRPAAP